MLRRLVVLAALIVMPQAIFGATQGGAIPVPLPLFPSNNWWNTDISAAPVDQNSGTFIVFIGTTRPLHPDFGGDAGAGNVYGMPFIIVDGAQAKKTVTFDIADESDGVGSPFYPIPDETITMNGWIEGGQPGTVDQRADSDRHMLIVDKTNNTLYELWNVWYNGTGWEAGSGAFFDMKTNNRRPEGWTSADAAGLAILPGLVRYDEVSGPNEINHAIRVTVRGTNGYVYPASHSTLPLAGALPMGARLRLKASKVISSFPADMQKIFRAFKKYGLIVADNGSDMYVSGTYDTRWNNDVLNPAFGALKASDFEVVQLGWAPSISLVVTLPSAMGAGDPADATVTAYDSNYNLATGYRGTIHFTSSDGAATLPMNYTFTSGDSGTHTFSGGFILRTPGSQTVTATDVADATITGLRTVTVGPATPTGLAATAATTTSINVTWNSSSGAAQYEVMRASASSGYATVTTTASTSYTDMSVSAGATYLYKVRAIDASSRPSPFSAPDAATTILFTEDPLISGVTTVKAVHVSELRQAANAMRAAAGLGATSFTDSVLTGGVLIRTTHLQEVRTALTQARAALGLSAISYTDPTLVAGTTVIKAVHVQELRNGMK
jgi:hypothetical protein